MFYHAARSGVTAGERSANVSGTAKAAYCVPSLTVVPLLTSNDPLVIFRPECTRVMQCGGCCSTPDLSCQPTQMVQQVLKVNKLVKDPAGGRPIMTQVPAIVDVHEKCSCECRVKKEHCNSLQVYNEANCKCECTNIGEMSRCERVGDSVDTEILFD